MGVARDPAKYEHHDNTLMNGFQPLVIGSKSHKGLPGYHPEAPVVFGVSYSPESATGKTIYLWEGKGKSGVGAAYTPREAILRYEKTLTHLKLANAEWFLGYIERMAHGETVEIAEILAADPKARQMPP